MGEIIYKASGLKPDVFASTYLFNKLGIADFSWEKFSNGVVFVSGDLKICPRDMAKLGYLYLNDGIWNGEQILSKEWIEKSISEYISVNEIWQYGYKWWIRSYSVEGNDYWSFSARGWGGQSIVCFPSLELVIVLTGGNYANYEPNDDIISQYILPSLI